MRGMRLRHSSHLLDRDCRSEISPSPTQTCGMSAYSSVVSSGALRIGRSSQGAARLIKDAGFRRYERNSHKPNSYLHGGPRNPSLSL